LAKERARVEAENRAERAATIRELLARNNPADTDSEKMLAGFRQAYPYHSQVLALSAPSADGSRTLIVSEPPPGVTTGDILLPLGGLLRNYAEKKQQIGYDGWVKDLVIEIAGSDAEVGSALSALNRQLFYTSYKSYVLPLPAKATSRKPLNLDLQVTNAELKSWLVDARATFTPVEGGEGLGLQQLFEQKVSGVFYRDAGGLVGWWLPKGRTVDESRVPARQFALDSDLIVGALSNPKGLLVLGRERIVPGELKQSYERRHLFAGRIDGNKDWAPILLSPELRDTEYGSLLNITDQLLKGWSNNGNTSYYNFGYPRPKSWPFKGSLMTQLNTDVLTYNWNTRGAGYTVEAGDYRLLALNRTGALPVSYIPEGSEGQASPVVSTAEESAYNYFAKLNDPNLVRVVQYAAMYQIFSAFNVAKPATPVPATSLPDQKLEELTNGLLAELRGASAQQLGALAKQLAPLVAAQLNNKQSVQQVLNEVSGEIRQQAAEKLQTLGYVKGTPEYDLALNDYMARTRAKLQGEIARYIAQNQRDLDGNVKTQLKMTADGVEPADEEGRAIRELALSQLARVRNLPDRYAEAAATQSNGWIHTPAVVISYNTGAMTGGVGGHNLDAKVTRFLLDDDVAVGTTRIDSEGNILVNSRDINRVNEVVRTAGRAEGELPSELSAELNSALRRVPDAPPRPLETALGLPAEPPLPPKGPPRPPLAPDLPGPDFGGRNWPTGWARPHGQLSEPEPLATLLGQRRAQIPDLIIVDRDGSGLINIANSEKTPAIKASTAEDAVDVVIQLMRRAPDEAQSLKIEFRGFQPHEADGFIKSCSVRATDEKIPGEISSVVDEAGGGGGNKNGGGGRSGGPDEPGGRDGNGSGGGGNNEGGQGGDDGRNGSGGEGNEEWMLGGRGRRYDFAKAEVTVHPNIDVLENGTLRSRITVEVPSADAGAAGRSTIELGFRNSTPREAVSAATRKVADSVRTFIRGLRNEYEAVRFNLRLNGEIKRVSREMEIDINIIRHSFYDGKGDLYFARWEERDEPPAPDTAACQSA
jgi:hypothetical protein